VVVAEEAGSNMSRFPPFRYRNVRLEGERLRFETSFDNGRTWYPASAIWPLLVIRLAWEHGLDVEDVADGFGPGAGTHGDWSAIRDSSEAAIAAMVERALNWLEEVLPSVSQARRRANPGYSEAARAFLAEEIPRLVERGMPQRQAVAAALAQARRAGLKVPKRNPGVLALVNPGTDADLMGTAVYEVRYRHAEDGADYVHEFEFPDSVTLWRLSPYQVLLQGERAIVEER
jgi:hypothetical protein